MTTETEIIIDETNFHEYFFDARKHAIQKGQILVCYSAMADFVDSLEKRQLLDLIKLHGKAVPATQVMKKLLHATELDSIRVPLMMAEDLLNGTKEDLILKKPYRYKVEIFYYTWPEYLPADEHWSSISLLNL